MIILDTNVLSELMRPTPYPRVVAWICRPSTNLVCFQITRAATDIRIREGHDQPSFCRTLLRISSDSR